jgi:hypothetical protein
MPGSRASSLLVVAFGIAAHGCTSSGATVTSTTATTLLKIDPSVFLGSLACAPSTDAAGVLHAYTVRLQDLSIDLDDACSVAHPELATVGPIPCTEPAFYGAPPLAVGHYYRAIVDGYDRSDLVPVTPGGPELKGPGPMDGIVAPRWTTTCGELAHPAPTNPEACEDATAGVEGDAEAGVGSVFLPFRPATLINGGTNELEGCLPFAAAPAPLDAGAPDASGTDASAEGGGPPDGGTVPDGSAIDGGATEGGAMIDVPSEDAGSTDGPSEDGGALDGPSSDAALE